MFHLHYKPFVAFIYKNADLIEVHSEIVLTRFTRDSEN